MSKQELHELFDALYASYVNNMHKHGRKAMPCRAFRARMSIWREW